MKYFRKYSEHLILEGYSLSRARKEYAEKIGTNSFNKIVDSDNTNNKKYVYWICRELVVNNINIDNLIDIVRWFDSKKNVLNIKDRDIYLKSYSDLINIQKIHSVEKKKWFKPNEMSRDAQNGTDILYEDDNDNILINY